MKLSNSDRYALKQISEHVAADDPEFAARMTWPRTAGSLAGQDMSPRKARWRACYRILAPCVMLAALIAATVLATVGVAEASVGALVASAAVFATAATWMCVYLARLRTAHRRERQ